MPSKASTKFKPSTKRRSRNLSGPYVFLAFCWLWLGLSGYYSRNRLSLQLISHWPLQRCWLQVHCLRGRGSPSEWLRS